MPEEDDLIGRRWTEIRQAARQRAASGEPGLVERALALYTHEAWEVRFYAVILLGACAASDERALAALHDRCGHDPAWQVHEGLAMAFDAYCAGVGYEAAVPVMEQWLRAPVPAVRRAVSEGLRPWTARSRPYFAAHPDDAVALLCTLLDDDSRSVQESVGNALRDISRAHFSLVLAALQAAIAARPDARSRRTIARVALKNAVKDDPALRLVYEPPHA